MAEYYDTEKIAALISASSEIMLVGHTNPDGDSVGSLIAMGCFLEDMGKRVMRVVPNELPRPLKSVKGKVKIYEFVSSEAYVRERARGCDLVICMDFNDISSRIGALSEVVDGCECPRILIDHHLNPSLSDFSAALSDTSASSTCYLVYKLITGMAGAESITPRMASAIYLGMATDTGKFSYGALTPDLFRAVAVLVERGADIMAVDMAVFNSQSEGRMRLVGFALSEKMVVLHGRRAAYITLTVGELNRFGHKSGDTEGLVNMPMQIEGIDTSALFLETGEGIKISLRSRGADGLDVNTFARTYFTGGGHRNAAGAKSFVSMDETVSRFIEGLRIEDEKRRG
ncbi:MAG: DHH family phosphoesterase [Rikenellaceae bacterium]|nr:DHH family phosphoesterase [Rikenellaceae bacterium]